MESCAHGSEEEPTSRLVGVDTQTQLHLYPRVAVTAGRDVSGARPPRPTPGPLAQGSSTRKVSPCNFWLPKPAGIEAVGNRKCWNRRQVLFKGTCIDLLDSLCLRTTSNAEDSRNPKACGLRKPLPQRRAGLLEETERSVINTWLQKEFAHFNEHGGTEEKS